MNVGGVQNYMSQAQQARDAGPAVPLKATPGTTIESETSEANDVLDELDFSLMTNAEIYDWMQSKHFAGELTPKDAWTIAYMMLDIPVGGLEEGQTMPIDDKKPVNFFAKVSDGIAWGKKEQDSETVARLESLFDLMKADSKKSIDVFA